MDQKITRLWFVIIFLVVIGLCIMELNGTIAKCLEHEKEIYKLNSVKSRNVKILNTSNGNKTNEILSKSFGTLVVTENSTENPLWNKTRTEKMMMSNLNPAIRRTQLFRSRSKRAEHKELHPPFTAHTADELQDPLKIAVLSGPEFRAGSMSTLHLNPAIRRTRLFRSRLKRAEHKKLHPPFTAHTADELQDPLSVPGLETRAGPGNNATNATTANNNTASNNTSILRIDDLSGIRKVCNTIVLPGDLVVEADRDPNLPQCRPKRPELDEPIPAILYNGRKNYGEECWTNERIAEEQRKGRKPMYEPNPIMLTDAIPEYVDVNAGLDRKHEAVDSMVCNQRKGLECDVTIITEGLDTRSVFECRCMAGFGRRVVERHVIGGSCYIPAGLGDNSACYTPDEINSGYPLPSGDTYNYREWNPVMLKCTPGSSCIENQYWTGKRCVCKKNFKLDETIGTCSFGIPSQFFQGGYWWNYCLILLSMFSSK